jgi:hypothetical protein
MAELQKLLDEFEKQCNSCNSSSSGQSKKPPGKPSGKPGSGKTAGSGSRSAPKPSKPSGGSSKQQQQQTASTSSKAKQSTTRTPTQEGESPSSIDVVNLLKDAWGNLPEREREQMLQAPAEKFLPKYELLIERYYKRLAEENRKAG